MPFSILTVAAEKNSHRAMFTCLESQSNIEMVPCNNILDERPAGESESERKMSIQCDSVLHSNQLLEQGKLNVLA